MQPLRQVKAPLSLVAYVINVSSAAQLLLSHHITKTDGKNSMICNQHDGNTEPLLMVIKSLSSEEKEQSKLNRFELANFSQYFRYTEIWTNKNGTKTIQLADPQLTMYRVYPELQLVDINYCVKP